MKDKIVGSDKQDLVQVAATPAMRETLSQLQEHGHIADLVDGYRLGISVAIAFGREPGTSELSDRRTMFSTSTLDPDVSLRTAIAEIYPAMRGTPYRAAEDLASQGLQIIQAEIEGEDIRYGELIERLQAANRTEKATE
jgi:hypothetical protein